MSREDLIDVATGEVSADVVIKDGKLVNIHTREIYTADVAIKGKRIAYVGEAGHTVGNKTKVLSAKGKYIVPGLIDPHIHVGESYLTIDQLARALILHGTTAVATDFYEIFVVSGPRGVKFALSEGKKTPLKIFLVLMQQIMKLEHLGTYPRSEKQMANEMEGMLHWPETLGINEPPLAPILTRDPIVMKLIRSAWKEKKILVGHYPFSDKKKLNAYLTTGANSDHESKTEKEALDKIRLGMRIMIREGSPSPDLAKVIKILANHEVESRYFMLCSDDEDLLDIVRKGHMDFKVRKAIKEGIDPVTAIQMATINVAEYLGIDRDLGSITPGKIGDILIVDKLSDLKISTVIADGKTVAQNGRYIAKGDSRGTPTFMTRTVRLKKPLKPADFEVKSKENKQKAKVRVIGVEDGSLIRKWKTDTLLVENGRIIPDVGRDIVKAAVVECHRKTGRIGIGFISGLGLKGGAIACTHNHLYQNLVVVGTSDKDMSFAANKLADLGGGLLATKNGRVLDQLPMPFGGVMTNAPYTDAYHKLERLGSTVKRLGVNYESPFLTLAFITLPAIPEAAITDKGLVDVSKQEIVDLIIS